MKTKKESLVIRVLAIWVLAVFLGFGVYAYPAQQVDLKPVAEESVSSGGISFLPKVSYEQIVLTVSRPDGTVFRKTFDSSSAPYIDFSSIFGSNSIDGSYTYELRVTKTGGKKTRTENEKSFLNRISINPDALVQVGHFLVQGGAIVDKNRSETPATVMDVVHNDDVIITGSQCIGYDCLTDGTESFGSDTIKLKENSLRIFFDDTSTSAGFPANDWRIITNDSSSGGGNYFAIEDSTGSKTPFKVTAGAPTSSLFVSSSGRVGLGTSTPVLNMHIVYGDSPSLRLEQDGSYGWTAQVWDISGNESNFFIRDTTGGSKLPFRIQPGSPTNSITIKNDGKVGLGTWSPSYALHVSKTGETANLAVMQTDGATGVIVADSNHVFIGAKTNHDFRLIANDSPKITILSSGNVGFGTNTPSYPIHMSSGAYCSAGGAWTNSSSRDLKENIQALETEEAMNTLKNLSPVKFNYKADKSERHVGFIAEDAPELVATPDKKGMSPMDVVAVLTKVVQEQQKTISELKAKLEALEKK